MSSPSTSTSPESGCSNPASTRSAVVLPQPDGPSRARSSPGRDGQVEAVEGDGRAELAAQAAEFDGARRRSWPAVLAAVVMVMVEVIPREAVAGAGAAAAERSATAQEQQQPR